MHNPVKSGVRTSYSRVRQPMTSDVSTSNIGCNNPQFGCVNNLFQLSQPLTYLDYDNLKFGWSKF